MENQIVRFSGRFYKSYLITENELWISQAKHKTVEKFGKEIKQSGFLQSAKNLPFSSIINIEQNDAKSVVKLKFKNHRNEAKKLEIDFQDKMAARLFAHGLGKSASMNFNQAREVKWKPLVINLLWLLATIGFTTYIVNLDNSDSLLENSTGKNKLFGLIIKLALDNLGKIGVISISALISIMIIRSMIKRYRKPSTVTTYQQKMI